MVGWFISCVQDMSVSALVLASNKESYALREKMIELSIVVEHGVLRSDLMVEPFRFILEDLTYVLYL